MDKLMNRRRTNGRNPEREPELVNLRFFFFSAKLGNFTFG
jgi:hypothetical protein